MATLHSTLLVMKEIVFQPFLRFYGAETSGRSSMAKKWRFNPS